ncbi:MAG TPA: hypothetical protein VH814_08735 [Steroidobacteraceae bacterium]|jgi:hypothetical protein
MKIRSACAALALFLAACGGGGGSDDMQSGGSTSGPPPVTADISLLFMGNSHTSANNLSAMVADMVRAGKPGMTVGSVEAPGWLFLDERLHDAATITLLRSQDWSFVILQAQKYSSSGQFEYSTEEAKELIRISREQHAVPVMFPEWPRRGIDETQRIYDLHVSIAQAEPACVAPIPQAFDLALARDPTLTLHASDGNHSSPAGAFLAALVLYATITGQSPQDLPALTRYPVDAAVQEELRGIAAETVQTVPPRMWCPADAITQ